MKKLLFSLLMIGMVMAAGAQNKEEGGKKEFGGMMKKMAKELNLTADQEAQFEPIYKEYGKELFTAMGELRKNKDAGQDKEARRAAMQQAAQQVRDKFTPQFASVLSQEQVAKLFQLENEMQKKGMHKKGHGGKPGKGHRRGGGYPNGKTVEEDVVD